MTVLAHTIVRPHLGKRQMTENRARQLAGIYARHGASVKLSGVVAGPNAGCIALLREYADFRTATAALQAVSADPVHVEFWREREANPAADVVIARDVSRSVHGHQQWSTHPVSQIRQYELTRDHLSEAVKLLGKVAELVGKSDVNVVGLVPIAGADLSRLVVSYQFHSIEHWGEALDTVGSSEEFQALIAEAAGLGTLRASFVMVPL